MAGEIKTSLYALKVMAWKIEERGYTLESHKPGHRKLWRLMQGDRPLSEHLLAAEMLQFLNGFDAALRESLADSA